MKEKNIPMLFGFPLWDGPIKSRLAKKYLNRWSIGHFLKKDVRAKFGNLKVGDLINDCTGFNGAIIEIQPEYIHRFGAWLLTDIDLQTENTVCSLTACGIEPELSRDVCEARHLSFLEDWVFGKGGMTWYGDPQSEQTKEGIARHKKTLDILKSGGHIADERGRRIK